MVMVMNNKAKIIIIDDEEVVLDSCVQILEGRNYDVFTAPDGLQGIKLVEEKNPDLVFIDLKMPGLPGLEVLEKIHSQDDTIVNVVITGYATVDSAVEAMKSGAYDFLPKPFTPDEFRLITKRGIERRRLMVDTITLRREKEMLRENFAAIVSHELKSPLGAIQQNLYALSGELTGKLSESQNAKLERMKLRIDDLIKLINSWLRVYSVDISKIKENFAPLSISLLLAKAIESAEPHAVRKDIRILTKIAENISRIEGDETSLVEALVNIIGNAVKYSYAGSQVKVFAAEKDGMVEISISDTGVGIPEEELPNVLSDFYRGSKEQSDDSSHGIGLTISRKIIEAHDGTILLTSKPSIGTTFTIRIPALKENVS
jgi:two-component system, sensor histidine kinase and response regulator